MSQSNLTTWGKATLEALSSAVDISISELRREDTDDQEKMEIYAVIKDEDTARTRTLAYAELKKPLEGYDKSDLFLCENTQTDEDILYYADASMLRPLAVAAVRSRWSAPEGCRISVCVETSTNEKQGNGGYRWDRSKEAMSNIIGLGMQVLVVTDTFLLIATKMTSYVHPLLLPDPDTLTVGKKGAELINAMGRMRQIKKINARTQRMLDVELIREQQ